MSDLTLNLYKNAAEKFKLSLQTLDEKGKVIRISNEKNELKLFNHKTNLNDYVSTQISKDKYISTYFFREADIPAPNSTLFSIDDTDAIMTKALELIPAVIKPNNRSLGFGVFVNLKTEAKIKRVLEILKHDLKQNEKVIVEDYFVGKEYRIIIYEDQIVDIIERIPAYIIGDGKSTIEQLIADKNKIRMEHGIEEPINKDEKLLMMLEDSNYNLKTIPNQGENIKLRNNCNFSEGGETSRINIDEIHADNIEMFVKAAKTINLRYSGLDLIIPDIRKSYKTQRCCINEINSSPYLTVNYYADFSKNNIAVEKILKLHFDI